MHTCETDKENSLEATDAALAKNKIQFDKVDNFFDDFMLFELHDLIDWTPSAAETQDWAANCYANPESSAPEIYRP
jgi:hypothetical protein